MDTYGEIKRKIRAMAAGKALIYEGEVKSVSGSTCAVDIGGVELSDVRLTALPGETDILVTPKVGSHVALADLEGGTLRNLVVVQFGEVDKITFNGGQNDGLVKIRELENNLNQIKNYLDTLDFAIQCGFMAIGAGTAANGSTGCSQYLGNMNASISFSNMEDKSITH